MFNIYISSSITWICLIRAFVLAAAALFGRNSVAPGLRFFKFTFGLMSQANSRGYYS